MATTTDPPTDDLLDRLDQFYSQYYREAIGDLASKYPQEQRSLAVDWSDLHQADPALADDYLDAPATIRGYLEEALQQYDLPVDVDLGGVHVRVGGLDDAHSFYPGEFSPSDHPGHYRSIRGEVAKATDPYARIDRAAFECQRCGTLTRIPQPTGGFQEPHECQGCERQGPFHIDRDQSAFVDGQKLRIQTPPEIAQGEGTDIDVFVEDDLTGRVTPGDRVTVSGTVELEHQERGSEKTQKFEPYIDGQHIAVEQTDAEDVDATADERERIDALAAGDEGDPLALAADSFAPKIHGYETVKKALVLALVGGSRIEHPTGDFDRGEFHVLLIGDPSTAKSKLVDRAEQVGWRAVGVSGRGATVAGVTASAVQDDFGDGSWTLDAGAAVKANRGVLAIDELDDMPAEVRSALLEPMSKQSIHITKGGINTHLQTRTAVVAAANPDKGRFDPYEPIAQQFAFSSTLISRFDLVFTFTDRPDADEDAAVAEHVLSARDAAKRLERGLDVPEGADPTPPVAPDTLRAWIALAKRQPKPVFADGVEDAIRESFNSLRGLYGYDEADRVPVTFRALEGIARIAEAAAKFEFSDSVEHRHAEIAMDLVGASMDDVGKDEDGNLDADVKEVGRSKTQENRMKALRSVIVDLGEEYDDDVGVPREAVIEELSDSFDADKLHSDMDKMLRRKGSAAEPKHGHIRYLGRA